MFLLICLLFQNQQAQVFEPMQPGSAVQLGSYTLTVPEGLLYANGSDAEHMLPLTDASSIPNCQGIFFSKIEDWSFCGIVLFLPFQNFTFEPMLSAEYFTQNFESTHLYYSTPVSGVAVNVIEPYLDPTEQSFVFGMEYSLSANSRNDGIYVKKIWLNAQDTLVIIIKTVDKDAYYRNLQAIDAMMASVAQSTELEPLPTEPTSFLHLFGFTNQYAEAKAPGLPLLVIISSVLLSLVGAALLIYAVKLSKKEKPEAIMNADGLKDTSTDTTDTSLAD